MGVRGGIIWVAAWAAAVCFAGPAAASSGGLVPSFGEHGRAYFDVSGSADYPGFLGADAEGRIVLMGQTVQAGGCSVCSSNVYPFAVRLTGRGAPDSTFGDAGSIEGDGILDGFFSAFAMRPDGRMLFVEGYGSVLTTVDPDGSIAWTQSVGLDPEERWYRTDDVLILPDDRILLGGYRSGPGYPPPSTPWVGFRLADGSPDSAYGDNGALYPSGETTDGRVQSLLRRPTGELLAVGSVDVPGGDGALEITQLQSNGTPDPGFGDAGTASFEISGDVEAAALGADRSLVVALNPGTRADRDALVRIDAEGRLISSFGVEGRTDLRRGRRVVAIIPMSGGRTLLVTRAPSTNYVVPGGAAELWMLDGGGAPDLSWGGGDGVVRTPDFLPRTALMRGGRLFVAGTTTGWYPKPEVALYDVSSGAGVADPDADGRTAPADLCPESYSTRTDGCPLLSRPVSMGRERSGRFRIYVTETADGIAGCARHRPVRLVRLQHGHRSVVFKGVTNDHEAVLARPIPSRGRYFAKAPGTYDGAVARCATSRSRVKRVR